jgi:hypothetical protein
MKRRSWIKPPTTVWKRRRLGLFKVIKTTIFLSELEQEAERKSRRSSTEPPTGP